MDFYDLLRSRSRMAGDLDFVTPFYKEQQSLGGSSNKDFGSFNVPFVQDSEEKKSGILDDFREGARSYLEQEKDKSDTDKYLDFLRESRDMAMGGQGILFGQGTGGYGAEVADGLFKYSKPREGRTVIQGKDPQPSFLGRLAGTVATGIAGPLAGGLTKAIVGRFTR